MRKALCIAGLGILLLASLFVLNAHAQGGVIDPGANGGQNGPGGVINPGANNSGGSGGFQLVNPLGANCTTLYCPVTAVMNFLFTLSIPLVAIFVLIGGFQMMTAAGNAEKFSNGKKTILYAVLGFIVIILAGSIASLIQSIFVGP